MSIQYAAKFYVIFVFIVTESEAAWTLRGSSEFAVAGESYTLTCNPQDSNVAGVIWKRLDIDTNVTDTNRATVETDECKIALGYDTKYQYRCDPGPIYILTMPANAMTSSQNNKVWRCEFIFGSRDNRAAAEYKVRVQVLVSSISIQPDNADNQPDNVIYENSPKTFYCITNGCRPKANITVTTTGVTEGQLTESTTQNGDLITTRVSQVITATKGGSTSKNLQCSAVNIQGRQPVTSQLVTLVVYYIPSVEPTLTGYSNDTVLYEGDSDLTLTCQQSGGYPLSVITWSCDGLTSTPSSGQPVTSSQVQLNVNRNLNRKTCTCTVRHPDNNLAYIRTLAVTFTVYYPPATPTVQSLGISFPWLENTQGKLRCTTTPGNPQETTYVWLQNSQVINGQITDTYTIPTLTNVHNGLRIQCRVSNVYTRNKPPAKVSNITVLDVQYTPIITLDTTNITVQEGCNTNRLCSAMGNPTPTVKWYRRSTELTSGTGNPATLVFSNIDRSQAETYQCKATATGKLNFESSKSLAVIVYYPPAVTISLQNTTENATAVVFTCNASDGFPTNYTYHGWNQYIGNTLVRSYTDFTGILSENNRKITIPKVTFEDIGRYNCSVENGFHGRQSVVIQQGSSYFDVRAPAKFDPKEEVRKPGELHKNLTVNITFYSNPPAVNSNIKWINKTSGKQLNDSDSISLNITSITIQRIVYWKTVSLTGQLAVLTITSLDSFHLGHYQLQIKNGGNLSSSFDFQIITSAPPEPPTEFSLAKNGTDSVYVTWKPGFSGGHPQTFVIRYTNTVTRETKEIKIKETDQNPKYTIEIDELEPDTTYNFWIYSINEKGNSTLSEKLVVHTYKEQKQESRSENIGAVAGGITGTSVAIIIIMVIVGVVFYRRRTQGKKRNESRQNGRFPLTARDQSDEEGTGTSGQFIKQLATKTFMKKSKNRQPVKKRIYTEEQHTAMSSIVKKWIQTDGMRDNVLYEPARPNFVRTGTSGGAGISDGATGGISGGATGGQNDYSYAEVQKNGKSGLDNPISVYAEVQKNLKNDKKPDPSAVYADFQKRKKADKNTGGKGGANPKTLIGKPKEKKPKPAKKTAQEGTLYENMDDLEAQRKFDEKKKRKSNKNKDGLIYVDILHESKPNGERRLVIHGLENKTDYAEVDFSRSGKPLPPDNNQTDKQEQANK